jgi:peptide/nickel transport system substrate-binding protein
MPIRRFLLLAAAVLPAACGPDAGPRVFDDVPEGDRYGGTAVIGSISDISDVNPLTSTDVLGAEVQQYVLFLPLISYDENLEPVPALARSWEITPDTSALIFHLRDDVYWHDGVKTTAYDMAFTYERARDPETGFPNTAFWTHFGRGEAVDSFTFRVEMRPHAQYLDPWRTFPPVPRHILADVPPARLKQHPFSTREPVGNGPFRVAGRIEGQSWTFEANPRFPEELGGRPYLDRIVYRWVPEPATLLTELVTGRIDFYNAPIPPEQAQRIEADPNARLITYPDRAFVIMGWNQRRPPFDDVRVRRALTRAIDRQRIVDAVLYGRGRIANSTVPPFFWQYDPEAGADMGHDPEGATALLREAGFTPGPDGILRDPQGRPFRFTLNTNQGNQARVDIAQIAQADLRRIGVQMDIQVLEWSTLLSRINDPRTRDFDAVLIGWRTEFRIDDTDLFHCDKRDDPYQWVGHCDPRLDVLMDTLPLLTDQEQARGLWSEYQRRVASEQPYTLIYFEERMHGVHNRLRNVSPDPRGDWSGIARWYIAQGTTTN